MNRALNDYVHLKQAYDLSQVNLAVSDSMLSYYKAGYEKQQSVFMLQEAKFNKQELSYKESLRIEKRKCRNTSIGVGVGGVLLGVILGVLLN